MLHKPEPGTIVHCSYRHDPYPTRVPLTGVVMSDNDPRIWANTLAFRGMPTQDQVDKHIEWCKVHDMSFDSECAIDYGEGCYLWDSVESLHLASECL